MCRHTQTELPAAVTAPATARRFTEAACRQWQLAEVVDTVALLVSELVTNAVLHAGSPSLLTLSVAQDVVEGSVADADPRPPVMLPARTDLLADLDALPPLPGQRGAADADPRHALLAVGRSGSVAAGRGIRIVAGLAERWGYVPGPDGKVVWFTVPVPGDWPGGECDCRQRATGTTASGRGVRARPSS